MLDTANVRTEISEARKAWTAYVEQRDALQQTIKALEAYIDAAEGLLKRLPVSQPPLDLGETPVKEATLRNIVKKLMQDRIGEPTKEADLYLWAIDKGAALRSSPEKGAEAVKFALYDLRKKDPSFNRNADGSWTYTPF